MKKEANQLSLIQHFLLLPPLHYLRPQLLLKVTS
ncbi:hypothetical protein G5S_0937 [Chlamydia pecorum E58]|uniref:Uncharacterized protein n=1 Tax=Chlamydia pecorum (strain ATCC VR-628 / DSM 29919 / E58) TaxID=331635 RepID=A0AA34WI88_CHLPE|nr:hypothetical protein G5S_0937 [Chlamydia pecorum E58]